MDFRLITHGKQTSVLVKGCLGSSARIMHSIRFVKMEKLRAQDIISMQKSRFIMKKAGLISAKGSKSEGTQMANWNGKPNSSRRVRYTV